MTDSGAYPLVQRGYGKGFPLVRGVCPSCGVRALFLGADGYVTCAGPTCGHPSAASDLLDPEWRDEARRHSRPSSDQELAR